MSLRDAAIATLWTHRQRDVDVPDLSELINRPRWHEHAACRGMGPDMFFGNGNGGRLSTQRAFLLCASCPVRQPCSDAAERDSPDYGVWGGMTAVDRARR